MRPANYYPTCEERRQAEIEAITKALATLAAARAALEGQP